MTCRTLSAANGNWLLLDLKGVARLHLLAHGHRVFGFTLILLASCIPAISQNTAALTIGGVMPSIQHLSINSIRMSATTNQTVVTLDAQSNADGRYSVTIQSKTVSPQSSGDSVIYQIKCGSRSFALAPGAAKILSEYADDKSAKTTLQISSPSASGNHILTLTVVSQ
jgi:hypothetical protein